MGDRFDLSKLAFQHFEPLFLSQKLIAGSLDIILDPIYRRLYIFQLDH